MKKALLLSEIFPPVKGGSGRWFWEVYNRLDTEQIVIAAGNSNDAQEFDRAHSLSINRLPLSSTSWGLKSLAGLRFYWRVYWQVKRLVKEKGIKALHCGRCLPEGFIGFLIKKTTGIPYICYIHGEDVETASTSRELSWIVHRSLKNADCLICNSHNTAEILVSHWGVDSKSIQVVHPGVDTTKFVPAPRNASIRRKFGWDDRPIVLTVGRLQKRKGQDMLIKSLPIIKQSFPEVLYAIIGEGEEKQSLIDLSKALGVEENVVLMSEISDDEMIECYQQCDIFALPNRAVGKDIEGFGIVLLEAQACAKPVIAGDSGGTSETMALEKSGYVIDCTSETVIASKIIDLLNDSALTQKVGTYGRNMVEENFDWKSLAQQAFKTFP